MARQQTEVSKVNEMLSGACIILFFLLMLLTPCVIALRSAHGRAGEEGPANEYGFAPLELARAQAADEPGSSAGEPLLGAELSATDSPDAEYEAEVDAEPALAELPLNVRPSPGTSFAAAADLARAELLQASFESLAAENLGAPHGYASDLSLDLDALRRMVEDAEAEALSAQLMAAQARAAALAATSRAAAARANAATEMVEMARLASEEAARAVEQTRESHALQREAELAAGEQPTAQPDPAQHYPRARIGRRAA